MRQYQAIQYTCNWSSESRDGKKEAEKKYLKKNGWTYATIDFKN